MLACLTVEAVGTRWRAGSGSDREEPRRGEEMLWGVIWVKRGPDILSTIVVALLLAGAFGILGGGRAAFAGYEEAGRVAGALAFGGMLAGPLTTRLFYSRLTGGGLIGRDGTLLCVVISLAVGVILGTGAVLEWGWPLWTVPLVALAGYGAGFVVASRGAFLLRSVLHQM